MLPGNILAVIVALVVLARASPAKLAGDSYVTDLDSIGQNEKILRLFLRLSSETANHLIRLKNEAKLHRDRLQRLDTSEPEYRIKLTDDVADRARVDKLGKLEDLPGGIVGRGQQQNRSKSLDSKGGKESQVGGSNGYGEVGTATAPGKKKDWSGIDDAETSKNLPGPGLTPDGGSNEDGKEGGSTAPGKKRDSSGIDDAETSKNLPEPALRLGGRSNEDGKEGGSTAPGKKRDSSGIDDAETSENLPGPALTPGGGSNEDGKEGASTTSGKKRDSTGIDDAETSKNLPGPSVEPEDESPKTPTKQTPLPTTQLPPDQPIPIESRIMLNDQPSNSTSPISTTESISGAGDTISGQVESSDVQPAGTTPASSSAETVDGSAVQASSVQDRATISIPGPKTTQQRSIASNDTGQSTEQSWNGTHPVDDHSTVGGKSGPVEAENVTNPVTTNLAEVSNDLESENGTVMTNGSHPGEPKNGHSPGKTADPVTTILNSGNATLMTLTQPVKDAKSKVLHDSRYPVSSVVQSSIGQAGKVLGGLADTGSAIFDKGTGILLTNNSGNADELPDLLASSLDLVPRFRSFSDLKNASNSSSIESSNGSGEEVDTAAETTETPREESGGKDQARTPRIESQLAGNYASNAGNEVSEMELHDFTNKFVDALRPLD